MNALSPTSWPKFAEQCSYFTPFNQNGLQHCSCMDDVGMVESESVWNERYEKSERLQVGVHLRRNDELVSADDGDYGVTSTRLAWFMKLKIRWPHTQSMKNEGTCVHSRKNLIHTAHSHFF